MRIVFIAALLLCVFSAGARADDAADKAVQAGFEPYIEPLKAVRLLRPDLRKVDLNVNRAAARFRAWIGSANKGQPTESEKALLGNVDELGRARDALKTWLLDYANQRKLVASGALNGEVGESSLDDLRQAVVDFRASSASGIVGSLQAGELAQLDAIEAEVDAFAKFVDVENKATGTTVTLPTGLVKSESDAPEASSWTSYQSADGHISVDQFRAPLRAETAVSLAARLIKRRTQLEFDRLDITGDRFAIEGYAKRRWAGGGAREYVAFGAREHNGYVQGYGLRVDLDPPADKAIPTIKVQNDRGRARPVEASSDMTPAQSNWRNVVKVLRNLMASKQNEGLNLAPISRSTCAGVTKHEGGAVTSVKIFYATDRLPYDLKIPEGAVDLTNLYSSNLDTKLHLGCLEVDVRPKDRSKPIGSVAPGMSRIVQQLPIDLEVSATRVQPLADVDFSVGKRLILRGDEVSGKERALIFVHGYNNGFKDAVEHVARIAAASSYYGQVYLFSWPSSARTLNLNYAAEMDYAEQAETDLTNFIKAIMASGDLLGLDVVAHSMGSQIVLRTLDSLRPLFDRRLPDDDKVRFGQIIFAAPDVSSIVFKQKVVPFSWFADRITVYTSSNDGALDFSGWLRGSGARAGYVDGSGPIEVKGIQVIDVTEEARPRYLVARYCGPYHTNFVNSRTVLEDISQILKQGASGRISQQRSSPTLRASNVSFVEMAEAKYPEPSTGVYWIMRQSAPAAPVEKPWYDNLLKDVCIR